MNTVINAVAICAVILCAGCKEEQSLKEQAISLVADKAFNSAEADSVDFTQYSLQSVQLLRDGEMGTIDDFEDEYISSVKKKLKGVKYWEACYMVTADMVLGAKYCYYLEHPGLNHLTSYRVK